MANDISTDELKQAYQAAGLRFKGWGFVRAMQTPSMLAALRGLAAARRLKQQPQLQAAMNREMEAA